MKVISNLDSPRSPALHRWALPPDPTIHSLRVVINLPSNWREESNPTHVLAHHKLQTDPCLLKVKPVCTRKG